jgi:hypothetical protein
MKAIPFTTSINRLSIYYSKPECWAELHNSKSTGLSVITNISPTQFNDRAGLFKTGHAAWVWARRTSRLTQGV